MEKNALKYQNKYAFSKEKDSENSDNDIDEEYAKAAMNRKQKHVFRYSDTLSLRKRIEIFRAEFAEFTNLEENHIRTLIYIYDKNVNMKYNMSDPAISTIGGLLLWVGWLFFNSTSGYEIVDISIDSIPSKIAINTISAAAFAAIMFVII